jgi:hypothetical protein
MYPGGFQLTRPVSAIRYPRFITQRQASMHLEPTAGHSKALRPPAAAAVAAAAASVCATASAAAAAATLQMGHKPDDVLYFNVRMLNDGFRGHWKQVERSRSAMQIGISLKLERSDTVNLHRNICSRVTCPGLT